MKTMASLVFDSGPQTGERILLEKGKVTFGRSKLCDFVLTHPTVSREHFHVERNNGKLFLVDHGGENGTFVNSERISWIELKDGDTIRAGPFTMIFKKDEIQAEMAERPDEREAQSGTLPPASELIAIEFYPREYLRGIEDFNAGRYFDAHEIWEEIWLRSSGDTKLFYQMLIQAAVGLHHYERGNARGARGMHANVTDKLGRLPPVFMSLDLVDFARQFKLALCELIDNADEAAPGESMHRPRITLLARDDDD
jgi:predicted metal-dependent hydrolase